MKMTEKLDKLMERFSNASIKLPSALLLIAFSLSIGISLGRNRYEPAKIEINEHQKQGISILKSVYDAQSGNEMLNPKYYSQF
ncbi:MAG: hypothetical protein AABX66_03030 [Nanoarchaeota archaeon]